MAGQGHPLVTFAELPEIKPLEAAPILFSGSGTMRFQQTEGAAEVALVPGVLRQTHVGVVKILVGPFAIVVRELPLFGFRLRVAHRSTPLPDRAGET